MLAKTLPTRMGCTRRDNPAERFCRKGGKRLRSGGGRAAAANHVMLGAGDAIWFSDGNGHVAVPPHNELVAAGSANAGVVDEIENPNAQPGTDNFYSEDGYGGGSFGSASFGGGTYSNCSDSDAPGVSALLNYLSSFNVDSRCAPGHYYLLNNYNPDITATAEMPTLISGIRTRPFLQFLLLRCVTSETSCWNGTSPGSITAQWNAYVANPDANYVQPNNLYCNICNPFQYSTSIMTNAAVRTAHLKDTADLCTDIKKGDLPAVSFVKPSGWVDGHPASSKLNLFEGFVKYIVNAVKANPKLWNDTAIIVTFDEGGGYYDSGYVQALDFFGDGTRIPTIVVSRFTKRGHISHEYADHVSILKFIEANWSLAPVTGRSRDNLPNPKSSKGNPYVPLNQPAISDLMDLFSFGPRKR